MWERDRASGVARIAASALRTDDPEGLAGSLVTGRLGRRHAALRRGRCLTRRQAGLARDAVVSGNIGPLPTRRSRTRRLGCPPGEECLDQCPAIWACTR